MTGEEFLTKFAEDNTLSGLFGKTSWKISIEEAVVKAFNAGKEDKEKHVKTEKTEKQLTDRNTCLSIYGSLKKHLEKPTKAGYYIPDAEKALIYTALKMLKSILYTDKDWIPVVASSKRRCMILKRTRLSAEAEKKSTKQEQI